MRASGVIEAILSLDEPWRGRFLVVIARTATVNWDGRCPTEGELEEWLQRDLWLHLWVVRLLRAWCGYSARIE